ncbi:MAG: DUF4124 domain-containing protein [Gammaproteobacteria bacterium]|nr:DUF4124 domain-containing protein [Gammaproteobacteria bacterium]
MLQSRPHIRPQSRNRAKPLPSLALLLALALPATLQAAEVYRWVDAQGTVHYSSVAPRNVPFERVDPGARPRMPASLANPREPAATAEEVAAAPAPNAGVQAPSDDELGLTEQQRERRAALQAQAENRRARLEAERRDQCSRARRQYEELTTHTRVRVRDDSGRDRLLSDAELQTRIAAARDAIVTNCD